LILLSLVPTLAQARDVPARVSVEREQGAEQCASADDIQRRVEEILRRPLVTGAESELVSVEVRFARTPDGAFSARVASAGPKPGTRTLRDGSPSCAPLVDAVSVAIALLLDGALAPTSEDQTTTATATTQATATDAPAASAQRPPQSASAPRAASSLWRGRVSIEAGTDYGLGGAGSLLGLARLGLRTDHLLLSLDIGETLPARQDFDGGSVRTSLVLGSARACYRLGRALTVAPCALVGLGRLHGEGSNFGESRSTSLLWTAVGLGLEGEASLGHGVFLALGATLWVPTRRQTFSVDNAGIAWESKPLAGLLSAGLGVELF
jgi:hypothetical protein